MAVSNPFLQAFRGVWTILELNSTLIGTSAYVKPGNCIKRYLESSEDAAAYVRDPAKREIQSADTPELEVEPLPGFDQNPSHSRMYRTTSGTSVQKWFTIWIRTGEQQAGDLFLVEWEVLRAMMNWKTTLEAMTWTSKQFIFDCRLNRKKEKNVDERSLKGWQAAWSGYVDMWFTSTDLIP